MSDPYLVISKSDIDTIVSDLMARFVVDDPEYVPSVVDVHKAVEMSLSEWVEDLIERFSLYQGKHPESGFGSSFDRWLEFYEDRKASASVPLPALHKV